VAQEGSLSGAARRLGLTQPTVARHVEALEQAVGADLFLRSQRGLTPTEIALELQPHAEALALTRPCCGAPPAGVRGRVRGAVRVSAGEVVGVEHLPPILADLRRKHPGLIVELVLSNALDDLLRREADIAVRQVEPVQGPCWRGACRPSARAARAPRLSGAARDPREPWRISPRMT